MHARRQEAAHHGRHQPDSIAFEVARQAQQAGAEVVLTGFGRAMRMTERAAARLPEPPDVLELDVNDPDAPGGARRRAARALGPRRRRPARDRLRAGGRARRALLTTPPESAATAFRTSAFSLKALAAALEACSREEGASLVGLDFDAQVAWPVYDWMGVAKAGARGGRPLPGARPRAARRACEPRLRRPARDARRRGIPGFGDLADAWQRQAPLGWDTEDPAPVAGAVLFLLSPSPGHHRRGPARRRRLPRDGRGAGARRRGRRRARRRAGGGLGMRPPVFMTGADRLPRHGGPRAAARGRRPRRRLPRPRRRPRAAEARLDGVLETLWARSGAVRARVRAVAGDLTSPGLGIDPAERTALAEEVGAVLHCAASITFDLPLEEARKINVEGTREMIGFAREAKALGRLERFLHVSTPTCRAPTPAFGERQLVAGQEFRNTYEQTKCEAEQLVAGADDLSPAVVRPSIVVGESDSGWTPAFNVLYWPLRAFSRGLFDTVPALADGRVDVVPVDYVADGIVHLLDRAEAGRVQPRRRPRGADRRRADAWASDASAARGPSSSDPGGDDRAADGEVYLPYFDMRVVFDDARARWCSGPPGSAPRAWRTTSAR